MSILEKDKARWRKPFSAAVDFKTQDKEPCVVNLFAASMVDAEQKILRAFGAHVPEIAFIGEGLTPPEELEDESFCEWLP